MSGFWMVTAGAGCLTTLLVEILLPCLLDSVFNFVRNQNVLYRSPCICSRTLVCMLTV